MTICSKAVGLPARARSTSAAKPASVALAASPNLKLSVIKVISATSLAIAGLPLPSLSTTRTRAKALKFFFSEDRKKRSLCAIKRRGRGVVALIRGGGAVLPGVFALDGVNFGDAAAVAVFGQLGRQPGADDFTHLLVADQLATERQDVRAVVLAAVARRRRVVTHRGAHARHLVGRHARADARAVNDDAEVTDAARDGPRHGGRVIRVIYRFGRVCAEILNVVV